MVLGGTAGTSRLRVSVQTREEALSVTTTTRLAGSGCRRACSTSCVASCGAVLLLVGGVPPGATWARTTPSSSATASTVSCACVMHQVQLQPLPVPPLLASSGPERSQTWSRRSTSHTRGGQLRAPPRTHLTHAQRHPSSRVPRRVAAPVGRRIRLRSCHPGHATPGQGFAPSRLAPPSGLDAGPVRLQCTRLLFRCCS